MQQAIIGAVVPALARRARVSWIGYGLAAYVALRIAKKYGVGGQFPDRALSFIDDNIRGAIGLSKRPFAAQV